MGRFSVVFSILRFFRESSRNRRCCCKVKRQRLFVPVYFSNETVFPHNCDDWSNENVPLPAGNSMKQTFIDGSYGLSSLSEKTRKSHLLQMS